MVPSSVSIVPGQGALAGLMPPADLAAGEDVRAIDRCPWALMMRYI